MEQLARLSSAWKSMATGKLSRFDLIYEFEKHDKLK